MAMQRWTARPRYRVGRDLHRMVHALNALQAVSQTGSPSGGETTDADIFDQHTPGSTLWPLLAKASLCKDQTQKKMLLFVQSGSNGARLELGKALDAAYAVYQHFIQWPTSVPERFKYMRLPAQQRSNPATLGLDDGTPEIFVFVTLEKSSPWLAYWSTCIYFLETLIRGYRLIGDYSNASALFDMERKRAEAVENILSSAPYMLGDLSSIPDSSSSSSSSSSPRPNGSIKTLRAYFLLQSLVAANMMEEGVSPRQRRAILDYLYRIGTSFGIRASLGARNRWIAGNAAEASFVLGM